MDICTHVLLHARGLKWKMQLLEGILCLEVPPERETLMEFPQRHFIRDNDITDWLKGIKTHRFQSWCLDLASSIHL